MTMHHGPSAHSGHMMPSSGDGSDRALAITGWLTGVYFAVELGVGIWTGSVAVISDAFHTFSAVGGVLIALVAGRLAARPATRFQTYGMLRAEIAGALINGFFLLGMALLVFGMGFMRVREPIDLPTTPMLAVAAGGLVTEFIALGLLYQRQKTSLNVKGAYWHILQTFGGSLIIIVAALVIQFTGFLQIDPILGMAFGLLLFWASWSIIREAFHILLDNVPRDLDLEQVRAAIEEVPGVESIHHMHAWSLTSGKNIVSAHVLVSDYQQGERVLHQVQSLLKDRFQVYFSTIQIETSVCPSEEEAAAIDYMRR